MNKGQSQCLPDEQARKGSQSARIWEYCRKADPRLIYSVWLFKRLSLRTAYLVSQNVVAHFGLWLFILCKSNSHYVYQIILGEAQRPAQSDWKLQMQNKKPVKMCVKDNKNIFVFFFFYGRCKFSCQVERSQTGAQRRTPFTLWIGCSWMKIQLFCLPVKLLMFHLGLFLQSAWPFCTEYMLKVCGFKMHGFALGEAGVMHLTRAVSCASLLCLILTNTSSSSLLFVLQSIPLSSYNTTYTVAGAKQTLELFELVSAVLQVLQLWIICN